jgi:hypothetical protein
MLTGPRRGGATRRSALSPRAPYDEAKEQGRAVIGMNDDWRKLFAFQ